MATEAEGRDLLRCGDGGPAPDGRAGDGPGEPAPVWREAATVPQIEVHLEFCKACGICIDLCPADVYRPGPDGKPLVAQAELCIWCERCEMYCPDLAIELVGERAW